MLHRHHQVGEVVRQRCCNLHLTRFLRSFRFPEFRFHCRARPDPVRLLLRPRWVWKSMFRNWERFERRNFERCSTNLSNRLFDWTLSDISMFRSSNGDVELDGFEMKPKMFFGHYSIWKNINNIGIEPVSWLRYRMSFWKRIHVVFSVWRIINWGFE